MKVFDTLNTTYSPSGTCAITIGSFDGVHLGHQALLSSMREKIGPGGTLCVLTFSNHPSQVLPNRQPVPLILSKNLKLRYLKKYGVDVVFCLDFTLELAAKSYDIFLRELHEACPFSLLVLGEGATLGKKREGTPEKVAKLGDQLGFQAEYIQKKESGECPISSNRIREYIQNGKVKKAESLLGHSFETEAFVQANEIITPLETCFPNQGTFPVSFLQNENKINSTIYCEGKKWETDQNLSDGPILIKFL